MSKETIKVPDLGGATDVEVVEISVAAGDNVAVDDTLLVLESDKASMEIPSPVEGAIVSLLVKEGDTLSEGDAIAEIDVAGGAPAEPATEVEQADVEPPAAEAAPEPEPAPEAAPTPAAQAESLEIPVPDLGGGDQVEVIEVCVAVGDTIAEGDSLVVLESDKASMEVPSSHGGVVEAIAVSVGDQVGEGAALITLKASVVDSAAAVENTTPAPVPAAVAAAPSPAAESKSAQPEPVKTTQAQPGTAAAPAGAKVYAGPAVRKVAREFGVELTAVKGSGPKGRILKEDVQDFVKSALQKPSGATSGAGIPAIPEVDFSKFGPVRVEKLSRINKVTAENMHRSWLNVPHVTQYDDVDITELEDFRKAMKEEAAAQGAKLTPLPFLLKAAVYALQKNPAFNASLSADGESMVFKDYFHIGIAVDTPAGLVVPVLRDVDKKSVYQLAQEAIELATKAKDRKLKPADMQGGCFTISSLGNIGGTGFTPIVNAPEVAILGVSRLDIKPVWNGSEFVPRKMLPLSLSYDHRAINGAVAGRFMTDLGNALADIRRLIL